MRGVYKLEADPLSHDTIEAARQIVRMAEAGEIIGLGLVVMRKGKRYWVNSAGECRRSPTWTRGALRDLDDELGAMVRQEKGG